MLTFSWTYASLNFQLFVQCYRTKFWPQTRVKVFYSELKHKLYGQRWKIVSKFEVNHCPAISAKKLVILLVLLTKTTEKSIIV